MEEGEEMLYIRMGGARDLGWWKGKLSRGWVGRSVVPKSLGELFDGMFN